MLFSVLFLSFLSSVTLTFKMQNYNAYTGSKSAGSCTAVYISPNRAMTAGHCVENAIKGKMWVRTDEGKSFPVRVLRANQKHDLALLAVDGSPHKKYARLAKTPLKKGDKVYLWSSQDDSPGTYNEGIVANFIWNKDQDDMPLIIHTAAILPGASGSGLFNRRGELVGINNMRQGAISSAVDILAVRHLLEEQEHEEKIIPR